jgi:hypothetical protein
VRAKNIPTPGCHPFIVGVLLLKHLDTLLCPASQPEDMKIWIFFQEFEFKISRAAPL